MVSLSLDTSEIVAMLRSPSAETRREFDRARQNGIDLVVSSVVIHELISGAAASLRPDRQMAVLETYLADLERVDFTPEDAVASGRLRAVLSKKGTPIGDLDTLIAGQALYRGWTVVTRNIRHFGRVEGLPLIDWSAGPDVLPVAVISSRIAAVD